MRPGEQFSPKGLFTGVWVPTWLAKVRKLPAAAKLVYGRAASLDTGSGVVEFRIGWMAVEVGLDEKTVRSSVNALEQREFWRVERPEGVDRLTHQPHRYVFLWHEAIGAASLRRTRMVDGPGETPAPKREEVPPRTGRNAHSFRGVGEKELGEAPLSPPPGGTVPAKVGRKAVTTAEAELAQGILAEFNAQAGTAYTSADHLRAIIGRVREHPKFDLAAHGRLIRAALAEPWWKGPPGPQVVYGNGVVFEQAIERAKAAKAQGGSVLLTDAERETRRRAMEQAEAARREADVAAFWAAEREREGHAAA